MIERSDVKGRLVRGEPGQPYDGVRGTPRRQMMRQRIGELKGAVQE